MEEVEAFLEEEELASSCFVQYQAAYPRMKQAGMFSLRYSVNAVVDPKNRFVLNHGGVITNWATALVDYPQMRRDPNSERSLVYGIRFRVIEFQGNAEVGFLPLEDFIAKKQTARENESILDHLRSYTFTYWGALHHGSRTESQANMFVSAFSQEIKTPGDRVELELDVRQQKLTILAWSSTFADPDKPAVMIEPIDLEDNVAYCWAASVGMPRCKYVIEEAWARVE